MPLSPASSWIAPGFHVPRPRLAHRRRQHRSKGEDIAEIAAMRDAGIVAVSDDGKPIATAKLARQIYGLLPQPRSPRIEHAEDVSLAAGAVMREGIASTRLGLSGMPAAAESVCVARDVQIAELTGARLHIAHLSAKASLEQVRFAKKQGLRGHLRSHSAPLHVDRRGCHLRLPLQDESAARPLAKIAKRS